MFKKILIANRGEIACRIIRSAKKMNIKTVAVYSEIDRNALHVALADEAYCIGAAASQQSYLNRHKIIEVAKNAGVEAIHPGYGFLSEDAEFAVLCKEQNLIYVGPPPLALASMGNKSAAKKMMQDANVPVVPGYHGTDFTPEKLLKEAKNIGYPLMVKAAAGGGGKGMRLVTKEQDLISSIESAQREAKSSFGDDAVFLEKYLEKARHVEVQIFSDTHGNTVHLWNRDCSIQRRHQKIIEEAPAPFLNEALREKMLQSAIAAANAIQYVNAGTIEFLVSADEKFYFMEMNTRLQVEHPVTEMITGFDLVEWQLRIAAGEAIPVTQDQIKQHGHAFEARICAENPYDQYKPSTGKIKLWAVPNTMENVRIDTGIQQGDVITPYYDPMLAKLIVWGADRDSALQKFRQALAEVFIAGINTNVSLLQKIAAEKDFAEGHLHTKFLMTHEHELLSPPELSNELIALAMTYYYQTLQKSAQTRAENSEDPFSPWNFYNGWQLTPPHTIYLKLQYYQQQLHALLTLTENLAVFNLTFDEKKYHIKINSLQNDTYIFEINGSYLETHIFSCGHEFFIFFKGSCFTFSTAILEKDSSEKIAIEAAIASPMPGTITEILIQADTIIRKGTPLITLEAMKMEHTLSAPKDGKVKNIFYQKGDLVQEGDVLIEIE
jgi:3-methylcrotonyl-CoA carboxylase alpha subunit